MRTDSLTLERTSSLQIVSRHACKLLHESGEKLMHPSGGSQPRLNSENRTRESREQRGLILPSRLFDVYELIANVINRASSLFTEICRFVCRNKLEKIWRYYACAKSRTESRVDHFRQGRNPTAGHFEDGNYHNHHNSSSAKRQKNSLVCVFSANNSYLNWKSLLGSRAVSWMSQGMTAVIRGDLL